jgi:molybdenum cofactor cytidylyltransferase
VSGVAAIVLAAGRGTRFGQEPKLLATLQGRPLLLHGVEAAIGSAAQPVIVVTGHRSGEIKVALEGLPIQIVHNASFAEGLSTSLKVGFAALPPKAKAAIILLGDMPLVTAALIDELVAAWEEAGEPSALVPTLNGQRGNPVIISRRLHGLINELSGDSGAGLILRGRSDVVEWPTGRRAVLQDVDTKEEFCNLR